MKILAMDTSSQALSVAICDGECFLGETTLNIKQNHSIELMPTIERLMNQVGLKPQELERIVVAQGPGSYTGLRIAVTTAKMLAYSLGIELVGVSSLKLIASNVRNFDGLIVPVMDARRQNVYAGVYQWQDNELQTIYDDKHIAFVDLLKKISNKEAYFTGEIQNFETEIIKIAPYQIESNLKNRLPSGYQLALLGLKEVPREVFGFVPEYLKKVEAEENWLKSHEAINDLVEKIK